MDPTKALTPCGIMYRAGILALCSSKNNIHFIGGAGSGTRGMDPTKAPPLCGIKFGAGILSSGDLDNDIHN
jgi:hypothetical protein